MSTLTHFNSSGRAAQVDVGAKKATRRQAIAVGEIRLNPKIIKALLQNKLAKGDALTTAKIAGILAAKRTAEIIPLCHSLNLDCVDIVFKAGPGKIEARAIARTQGRTGVEMEALTAVTVACLTLYDMCKSLDKSMEIGPIYLLEKTGGKSGLWRRPSNGR
ncbi:MAG: cyclic pyranopterin monophosphate synthase MoaC [Elusimicrobia bacterium]|nr:cyclic pyranopterin monophosphate synthase MoaC [Elusimicrobiota bacterium]